VGIAPHINVTTHTTAFLVAVTYAPNLGQLDLALRGVSAALPCTVASIVARVVQPGDQIDSKGGAIPGSFASTSCQGTTGNNAHGRHRSGARSDTVRAPGPPLRGCASIVSVEDGVSGTTNVVLQFGPDAVIQAGTPQTNTALIILQCRAGLTP
jgi:hypothetical protein